MLIALSVVLANQSVSIDDAVEKPLADVTFDEQSIHSSIVQRDIPFVAIP
jgi:hypothetical protein